MQSIALFLLIFDFFVAGGFAEWKMGVMFAVYFSIGYD